MKVVNRDGEQVHIDFEAIKNRLIALCSDDELERLDIDRVVIRTISGIEDNITTSRLDELSAMICASLQSHHYLYDVLAGRILVSNLHKNVRRIVNTPKRATFSQKLLYVSEQHPEILNPAMVAFVSDNAERLDAMVDYTRDRDVSYFAFRTLEKAYLMRANDVPIESPQDMWMRVAVALYFPREGETHDPFDDIEAMYGHMSRGWYTHATPTLFNAGTQHEQMSSCYLLGTDDSLSGIYKTLSDCAQISKWAGGLGVHVTNVRAKGSSIKSTGGKSDGIVPMLKVFNETARYCNQCFVPDTVVYTETGCKAIKDVSTADAVLTSDGTFRKVLDTIVNHKSEDIFVIRPQYSVTPLECTGVHDIFALVTDETDCDRLKSGVKRGDIIPGFVPANALKVGDFMAYPIPAPIESDDSGLSEDDCRFYGIMVGCGGSLQAANPTTTEWMKDYLHSAGSTFHAALERLPDLYDASGEVFIAPEMLVVSDYKALQIVVGILECSSPRLCLVTPSKQLVEAFRYLLLRLGIPSSGSLPTESMTGQYEVWVPDDLSLCERLGIYPSWKKEEFFVAGNMLYTRISSIETKQYTGDVYDLSIEGNHEYATNCGLVHNSGRRKGSIAIYLEPWHADVFEFIELRRQTGAESVRARDLFLALWIPDEFMRRVLADDDWYLMTPDVCPGLQDAYGEAFDKLYQSYIDAGKYVRKVSARSLWTGVLQSQVETGTPYIMFKDSVNKRCNQNNIGTIKSSNLCSEVTQYSDHSSYAVCNLGSLAVNRFYDVESGTYDFASLHEATRQLTRNLNRVIDINFYPTPETRKSNMEMRPIGIGVQGLGDLYNLLKLPYDDPEAVAWDGRIMEAIYHGAVTASIDLAKRDGPYARIAGSMFSKGILQFDLYEDVPLSGRWDWDSVRADLKEHGIRNSMLTALMPTASTSQILGNVECFEPIQSNVFKRTTLAGEFLVVNKHLMRELESRGLWSAPVREALLRNDGSLGSMDVPEDVRKVYKTVWELGQKSVIDHAASRAPFVDQSQSMNLFFAVPNYNKMHSALVYAWKRGLKTGCYYMRSKPAAEAMKVQAVSEAPSCKRDDAGCIVCSA